MAEAGRVHPLIKRVVATAIGLALGLLLAEAAVRLFVLVAPSAGHNLAARDPLATIYEPYGNFGYRPKPGRIETFSNETRAHYNSLRYRGPLVRVEKPTGTYRIVLLGGSTAVGYGASDDETIDAHLRRLLGARFPQACVEVVSLALGGYDSYQDYERFRVEGASLTPNLVIIHSGINDVRNAGYAELSGPPDPRTLLWESTLSEARKELTTGPRPWTLAKHYSYLARLPGWVRELARQRTTLTAIKEAVPHPAAADYFETNVMNTIRIAQQAGAAVVLSVPPSALSIRNKPNDPVEKSYWIRDAETTETYRERLSQRMRDIADRERAAGRAISYLSYQLPLDQFLDDAHLLGSGNATVARSLADSIAPLVAAWLSSRPAATSACASP